MRRAVFGLLLIGCRGPNPAFDEPRSESTTGSAAAGSTTTSTTTSSPGAGSNEAPTADSAASADGTSAGTSVAGTTTGTVGSGTTSSGSPTETSGSSTSGSTTTGGVSLGFACGDDTDCNTASGEECCTILQCQDTCMVPCADPQECPQAGMGCEHGYCLFACDDDDADCDPWPGFTCQHGGEYCEND